MWGVTVIEPIQEFDADALSKRWVAAIEAAAEVVAFSPYITDSDVIDAFKAKGAACTLYTVATAEVYASRGSTLSCLQGLIAAGVHLFHIERLHAKLLLVSGKIVTIGSQNMTGGGTRNREATVIFEDPKQLKVARRGIKNWRRAGKPITDEFLRRLEEDVERLRPDYKRWEKAVRKVIRERRKEERQRRREEREEKVRQKAEAERLEAERIEKENAQNRRTTHRFRHSPPSRTTIQRFASQIIWGALHRGAEPTLDSPRVASRNGDNASFLMWTVDGQDDPLKKGRWYPCYSLDTGRWGYARVYMTCISFVRYDQTYCYKKATFEHAGRQLEFGIRTRPNVDDHYGSYNKEYIAHNLEMCVYKERREPSEPIPSAKLFGTYGVDYITADAIVPDYDDEGDLFDQVHFEPLAFAINQNQNGIQELILHRLHAPLNRTDLAREFRVDRFFDAETEIHASLVIMNGDSVLLFGEKASTVESYMQQHQG